MRNRGFKLLTVSLGEIIINFIFFCIGTSGEGPSRVGPSRPELTRQGSKRRITWDEWNDLAWTRIHFWQVPYENLSYFGKQDLLYVHHNNELLRLSRSFFQFALKNRVSKNNKNIKNYPLVSKLFCFRRHLL